MKFRLDDEAGQTVLLKLEKARYGTDMLLMGTLGDGCKFTIMAFHENGTFTRHAGIPIDSGFELSMTNEHGVGQQMVEAEASVVEGAVTRMTATQINDVAVAFDNMNVQPINPVPVLQPEDYDEDEDNQPIHPDEEQE